MSRGDARAAVRSKYSEEAWEQIERIPEGAKKLAQLHSLDPGDAKRQVDEAERVVVRARHDIRFALDLAEQMAGYGSEFPEPALINLEVSTRELHDKNLRVVRTALQYRQTHGIPWPTVAHAKRIFSGVSEKDIEQVMADLTPKEEADATS